MAKLNGWTKLIMWGAGVVFCAGMAYAGIFYNAKDIRSTNVKVDANHVAIEAAEKSNVKQEVMLENIQEDVQEIKEILKESR